jgi:hypothetical protein
MLISNRLDLGKRRVGGWRGFWRRTTTTSVHQIIVFGGQLTDPGKQG